MILTKVFETKIDLVYSNDTYTQNLDKTLIKVLKNMFEGKCFESSYILNVNRIIKSSEIYMSDNLDGSASCCCSFECEVFVYIKGEIITGCHIQRIESGGQTYAESKYCSLQFKQDPALAIYKENYIVPAIVDKIRYYPNQDKISIGALPFTPIFTPLIIYKITTPLSESDEEDRCISMIYKNISIYEAKIKAFSNVEKNSYEFFKNLLYPFKKVQSLNKTPKYKDFDIKDFDILKTLREGFVCRPVELEKFLPKVYYSKKNVENHDVDAQITSNTMFEIIMLMLQDYLQYLILLCEMVQFYPDYKIIERYAKVWQIYNMLKR